jgi:hypothetical protein
MISVRLPLLLSLLLLQGVLQYVLIRVAATLVALYMQLGHLYYAEGDFDSHVSSNTRRCKQHFYFSIAAH